MSAVEELNQERRITFCLYECWEKLAGEDGLPALKYMNRDEIAPFKKNLVLIDLRNGHENPTFQVIGTHLQEDLDEDLSNKLVSDVPRRTMLSRVTDHYLEVLANRVPIAFEAEFVNTDSEKALYRGILLPFSDDGQNINFILGGVRWILEKDVTLDDSKPTIEELMRSISDGREDTLDEHDEEDLVAENNATEIISDTPEEIQPSIENSIEEEDEDDFNQFDEEPPFEKNYEEASFEEELHTEDLIEDNAKTSDLVANEEIAIDAEAMPTPLDANDSVSGDDFNSKSAIDENETTTNFMDIDDSTSRDVITEFSEVTENTSDFLSGSSGIIRKDFIPEAQEDDENEIDLICDIEDEVRDVSEQVDENDIFADTEQSNDTLFETAKDENIPFSEDDSFSNFFDADDSSLNDTPEPTNEADLITNEDDSPSFVESLEKELYDSTDDVEITNEEALVLESDTKADSLLEQTDNSTFKEVPVESINETIDDPIDHSIPPEGSQNLTLNELLSNDADNDEVSNTAYNIQEEIDKTDVNTPSDEEDTSELMLDEEYIEIDDTDAFEDKIVQELTNDQDENDKNASDQHLEENDPVGPIDFIAPEDCLEEGIEDLAEVNSDDELSIEELMQSIISERNFEPEQTKKNDKSNEENTGEPESSETETLNSDLADNGVQEDLAIGTSPTESPVEDNIFIGESNELINSNELIYNDAVDEELQQQETLDSKEIDHVSSHDVEFDSLPVDENVTPEAITPEAFVEDDSVVLDNAEPTQGTAELTEEEPSVEAETKDNDDDTIQDAMDLGSDLDIDETSDLLDGSSIVVDTDSALETTDPDLEALSTQDPESDSLSSQDDPAEFDDVALNDIPQDTERKSSVIERAMERMAPSFVRAKDPVIEASAEATSLEATSQDTIQEDTVLSLDNAEPTQGTAELTEEEPPVEVETKDSDDDATSDIAIADLDITSDITSDETLDGLQDDIKAMETPNLDEDTIILDTPAENNHDQAVNAEIISEDINTTDVVEDVIDSEQEDVTKVNQLKALRSTLKQIIGYIKKEDKNHNRSRDSLYNILTAIYEFHTTCEDSPEAYEALLDENDLKVQSRAPYTPVLKICLGKDYDKTRLTEYAAALGISNYMNVDVSEFHAFIKNFPGGIKGCVKEMRAIRKHGTSGNITARKTKSIEEAREILRDMAPIASFRLKKIIVGNNVDEFCLLLAKRDGHDINVLKILDEKYTKLEPIIKRTAFIKGNLNDRK